PAHGVFQARVDAGVLDGHCAALRSLACVGEGTAEDAPAGLCRPRALADGHPLEINRGAVPGYGRVGYPLSGATLAVAAVAGSSRGRSTPLCGRSDFWGLDW